MKTKTCCFIGHRKIEITDDLKQKLYDYIENLIVNEKVEIFLFGSISMFDDLCYDIVNKLKEKYPDIKRIYVRSSYEEIDDFYKKYLLESFEETCYPENCKGSGKLSYIKRNQAMIDRSDFCVFYYDKNYLPPQRKWAKRNLLPYQPKSGTALAYRYATQKKKFIKNFK